MPELICKSDVKKLLMSGINCQDYKALVGYLNSNANAPIWDTTLLWNPGLREKYWQAMVELQKELVPNHINVQVLYNKLWGLFREVVLNKQVFQSTAELQKKTDHFSREVKKPLVAFDVIYEIRYLDIGIWHFTLGNVEIFKLTAENMQTLGVTESDIVSEWRGRSVAKLGVNASEVDLASASGITEVNDALNVLRLAARKELLSSLSDDMFLWELGESMAISKLKPEEGILAGFDSGKGRPLIIDLGERIAKGQSLPIQDEPGGGIDF